MKCYLIQKLATTIVVVLTSFSANSTFAQITPDGSLTNNSKVTTFDNITNISGGTQAGSNLFHSFEQFSVPTGQTAYFNSSNDIQNIISRVTGQSISNIDGIIRANGTANLFLLNPNGIIFGNDAALNIGGSFIASTADSLNFADGTKFSASESQATPLLSVNVPIGLQFGKATSSIRNQSQAIGGARNFLNFSVGLAVQQGKTLALIGGDVTLEGGNLTAPGGRVELGSVAPGSFVSLNQTNRGLIFGYSGVQNFQNIKLTVGNIADSQVPSIVDTSGEPSSGSIQVQGQTVELTGNGKRVSLLAANLGNQDGGDITINAQRFFVRDAAQVLTSTFGAGAAGNLTINAVESVKISGNNKSRFGIILPSLLFSATFAAGKAGNITINTRNFLVNAGARVSTESNGISSTAKKQFIPATGSGGNLTINASESIELVGDLGISSNQNTALEAGTNSFGNAGNLSLITQKFTITDGASATVSSSILQQVGSIEINFVGDTNKLGNAGNMQIIANDILLDNQASLKGETTTGQGNINIEASNLILRRNSNITTNATGDNAIGGNININTDNLVAFPREDSNISASSADFRGGNIIINADAIFGFQFQQQSTAFSNITASGKNSSLNGTVQINLEAVNPSSELVKLQDIPIDPSRLVVQECPIKPGSSFTITGRGGLPPLPNEPLRSNQTAIINWVTPRQQQAIANQPPKSPTPKLQEAEGWIKTPDGQIFLVANSREATPCGKK